MCERRWFVRVGPSLSNELIEAFAVRGDASEAASQGENARIALSPHVCVVTGLRVGSLTSRGLLS